jgi:hypothetical protein
LTAEYLPRRSDLEIELESVALVDPGQARAFHRADVHEGVFLAVVAGMKPKPFIELKNLTVPVALSPVSWRCGPAGFCGTAITSPTT